jgi:acetyl-CoA C-acetyltransferase
MPLDPRTPVLVGVGAVCQREEDPARAREAADLMLEALRRAGRDAGCPALLERAGLVLVPRGFTEYRDPGRLLAERLSAASARTWLSELGVLQTTLFAGAAGEIAAGRADVVLVAGGEARHRHVCAERAGVPARHTRQPASVAPDRVLWPEGALVSELEVRRGLVTAASQYALIENALRAAEGQALDAHLRELAELWAGLSRIAADNPDAWSPARVDAETIQTPRGRNRMLAFPYTKLHNSQWNVDQAAGLVFCSAATARALGIPRERWVLPLAVAESNHMLPLTQRRALHRSPGFARAGEAAGRRAGRALDEARHLELYSCFPVAVRVQQRELRLPRERAFSVTGGMAFAGGPLNNFVLQALVRMAHVLRGDPGSLALVTAVSGLMTKQGVSLWSTEPGPGAFACDDVSAEAAAQTAAVEVVGGAQGEARLASYTVLYDDEKPSRAVLLCDLPDGRRALLSCPDPALAEALTREEGCGRALRLAGEERAELA